jgi:hypothetical protein
MLLADRAALRKGRLAFRQAIDMNAMAHTRGEDASLAQQKKRMHRVLSCDAKAL